MDRETAQERINMILKAQKAPEVQALIELRKIEISILLDIKDLLRIQIKKLDDIGNLAAG